jgi:hypothetical protein
VYGVVVHDSHGKASAYRHVFTASHSEQALAMLSDANECERSILSAIAYSPEGRPACAAAKCGLQNRLGEQDRQRLYFASVVRRCQRLSRVDRPCEVCLNRRSMDRPCPN